RVRRMPERLCERLAHPAVPAEVLLERVSREREYAIFREVDGTHDVAAIELIKARPRTRVHIERPFVISPGIAYHDVLGVVDELPTGNRVAVPGHDAGRVVVDWSRCGR